MRRRWLHPSPHQRRRRAWARLAAGLGLLCTFGLAAQALWRPLADDNLHDRQSPAITQLQEPAQALSALPRDFAGNRVRWVLALESGAITPRTGLASERRLEVRDDEFIIAKFGSMPAVKFPHRPHTQWLSCENCHDKLFKAKAGANRYSMTAILNGEQCGLCHGAVAFPLTECLRCHSVSNASLVPRRPAP